MRPRGWLAALLATVALLAGATATPAVGTWGDTSEAEGAPLALLTLTAPTLGCAADGLGARVSWTPSSDPTALTYTAQLVSPASGLSIVSNGVTISPGLLDGLLGGLLGTALTVRVTASLPGTSWSVSTDRVVYYKLVILVPTVSCSP